MPWLDCRRVRAEWPARDIGDVTTPVRSFLGRRKLSGQRREQERQRGMIKEIRPTGDYPSWYSLKEDADHVTVAEFEQDQRKATITIPRDARQEIGLAIVGAPSQGLIDTAAQALWEARRRSPAWGDDKAVWEQSYVVEDARILLKAAFGVHG